MKKLWREAATLFLVTRSRGQSMDLTNSRHFDYKVVLLQRSAKSRFMPNFFVTPGGVIDKADFSDEWMDLYQKSFQSFGLDFSELLDMKGPRPQIFRKSNTSVPREVAFRICAIRETFEEAGVLLVKKLSDTTQHRLLSGNFNNIIDEIPANLIRRWRKEVHNDASKFIQMCREFNCVPDVWALGEWSNWLTPADMKIRFDTAFFICFVDQELAVQHDQSEMVQTKLKAPPEILSQIIQREYKVGLPQLYEILRFARFNKWSDLKKFQEGRQKEGSRRWMPITAKYRDGRVFCLPGDALYSSLYSHVETLTDGAMGICDGFVPSQEFTGDMGDFNPLQNIHRIIQKHKNMKEIHSYNYEPPHGQCHPLTNINQLL